MAGKTEPIKIWKTEPMEILHRSLCTFRCRKVITCECPCINILSIEISSYLNVETEPRTKWCGNGETEPTENFHLGNRKMSNYQLLQSLGLQFSECQWKQNIGISHCEKIKKWPPFHKYASYRKI